jgi:hypothetical protein
MFKSMAAGGIAMFAAFIIQPSLSQAGTDVDVSIGAGGYPAQYYPHYPAYNSGYPGYDDNDEDDEDDYDYISCGQGRWIVRAHGFRQVRVLRCSGEVYKYQAVKRYQPWIVRVSARLGRIISVRPVRGYY